ncbi:hypothetical protein ACFLQW_00980 [Candidatus Zixiibacteriota bacterium]
MSRYRNIGIAVSLPSALARSLFFAIVAVFIGYPLVGAIHIYAASAEKVAQVALSNPKNLIGGNFQLSCGSSFTIEDISFGVIDGKLALARMEGVLSSGRRVHKDVSEHMDYIVEDLRNFGPVEMVLMCEQCDPLESNNTILVSGLTLGMLESGAIFFNSINHFDEQSGAFRWGGTEYVEGELALCASHFSISCDNSFCFGGNCVFDIPDCDFCDCTGTGFCLEISVTITCTDTGCMLAGGDKCIFYQPTCVCECFKGRDRLPMLTDWGVIILLLLLLTAGVIIIRRRRVMARA